MPTQVWNFREHIQTLVAEPEIRARFALVPPGPPAGFHSHDLGGEVFLVLDGEVTFGVEDEVIVCKPGEAIYVAPHVKHRVYNQSGQPAIYYLSVTPHIDPTHTTYDDESQRRPPNYGGWRGAGNPSTRPRQSTEELADELVAEADELARLAEQTAAAVRRHTEVLRSAAASDAAAREAVDAVWRVTYPTFWQMRTFAATWNELAPRAPKG